MPDPGLLEVNAVAVRVRHSGVVRLTHWITTIAFLALLVSGMEIVLSHPRFYWGETGNVRTAPLFTLPLPSSRDTVPTGYGYVLPDQNGWSRYLHFEAGWLLVLAGLLYVGYGVASGHFRRNLVPSRAELTASSISRVIAGHLRSREAAEDNAWSYNVLQRLTYVAVIFILFPLVIWTGLGMSPAVASAVPLMATAWGGQQSARTLHFFLSILLAVFLLVHLFMIYRTGFRKRTKAMVTGSLITDMERP
jgi:thiosulfate reductase cytochrome b subunit